MFEIADKLGIANKQDIDNPVALHLRGMNMLFEGLKETGLMVIVTSSVLDSMNLGTIGRPVSLAKANEFDQHQDVSKQAGNQENIKSEKNE